ncbi:MAG TPA: cytidine deaminase [Aestuariivirga sp.]|jgi:cytidine deaminase|nr:cytidine deaminase [Hyphomicrobiales bacterium]MBP9173625.1 cytidine deaminase [Hyphomicrobiales bacterium]HQY73025.1 cytidine deaminase [Aestuariivirga sp.]HRA94756.1 cytidine deaminase [Aestuariivirga sp.]
MNDLIAAAKAARLKAYAPYSKFLVGAALRDENGKIHGGCNIENAAYPQGWCAETSAIAAMIMAGGHSIAEMAVIGTGDLLCTPCGGCRQKIREFARGSVKIHMCGEDGTLKQTMTLDELLPASFGPENLA